MWPFKTKLNRGQAETVIQQGEMQPSNAPVYTINDAYSKLEVVRRGVDMLVDSCSQVYVDVKDSIPGVGVVTGVRGKTLDIRLNYQPNPYQTREHLFRSVFLDLILEGDAFLVWDGAYLYNLPASNVTIHASKTTFIDYYEYGTQKFSPSEVIWISDNNSESIFRGKSRLHAAATSIKILNEMLSYQGNFFRNGTVPGIVLSTESVLSEKVKERILKNWMQDYRVGTGGKRPVILDGDMKLSNLGTSSFYELDFNASIKTHEAKILKAIGVPELLLDGGNNANINPNLRLFYIMTVLPLVNKVLSGLERFFGFDLAPATGEVLGLRPELNEHAEFLTKLVNAGIMTRNEARAEIRLAPGSEAFANELVLPANIAGSAYAGSGQESGQGAPPKK